jgi:DNA-binding SARP family transcriptional activator/tetratricopeptide (TPR) repeat protein
MAVEFRLLGEIDVLVDGRSLDVGPIRQRSVLAALLIDANRTVATDELVDRVWGGHRHPDRPASALQTYVSLLRRILVPIENTTITRHSAGYRLLVDDRTVDLHEFRRLVQNARGAGAGDPVVLFEKALQLWRGDPFATVDTPWINGVRATLNNERRAARLDLTDIQLDRGQHAVLLAALFDRTAEQPLDERLASQFMLALYRSGRQAAALQHFQLLRRRLRDELGVDPSQAVRQLYQQILTTQPALAWPPIGTVAVRAPIPRQLPASPRLFTGREAQLSWLTKALDTPADAGVLILAIGGIGGIGKTWLALHWAYRHLDRFPDGQLYANLRGFDPSGRPTSPATAVRGFLDALGVEPAAIPPDVEAQIGLYRSLLVGRRMLIVLDNAADTAHISSLLPGSPTCTVLVTSRRRLTGLAGAHGARMLQLDALTDDDARQVLIGHLGAERLATQWGEAAELLDYCAGLPLAISIVAARANTHPDFPLSSLAAELRDHTSRLDALEDRDQQANVRAVLSWSFDALTADAATVFGLLGVAPGPDISRAAVEALSALPATEAGVVLRELENMHLLHQYAPGRYRMHDLVRLDAADRVRDEQPVEALRRLIDFYLFTAMAGDRLLDPHRPAIEVASAATAYQIQPLDSGRSALAWFTAEHANLQASQHLAAGQGWHVAVWQLAWALDTFHWRRGHLNSALAAWQAGLAASKQVDDPAAQILVHRRLGHAYALVGQHPAALAQLRAALTLAERSEDLTAQAHIHHSLAWAWEQQGDDRRALEHASHALPLYQRLGMPVWEARELNAVGWYHARLGEHGPARARCEAALALFREHANRTGEANTLDSLGYIEHRTGRYAHARDYYRQALAVLRDLGHAYQEADTLDQLGHTHAALSDNDQARTAWQQAEQLYRTQGRSADADRARDQLRP